MTDIAVWEDGTKSFNRILCGFGHSKYAIIPVRDFDTDEYSLVYQTALLEAYMHETKLLELVSNQ